MKGKVLFELSVLLGITFVGAGLNKLSHFIVPLPKDMAEIISQLNSITWLLPLIATIEIIGGTLLIISKYRALGAIVVFPITTGILLTHLLNAPSELLIGIVIFVINVWIIFQYKEKYLPMIK